MFKSPGLTMFSARDKDNYEVKFQAPSWEAAEARATERGYTDLGEITKEIPA